MVRIRPMALMVALGVCAGSGCAGHPVPAPVPPAATFDAALAKRLGADERGMRRYVLVILKTGPTRVPDGDARKAMFKVNLKGTTIPHQVTGRSGASTVVLAPARPGTGVTAGKSVRPCVELAGITDILTKAYGSTAPKNLVKATMAALKQLQNREQVEQSRGVQLEKGAGELVTA